MFSIYIKHIPVAARSRCWIIRILSLYIAPHPPTPLNTQHVKSWEFFFFFLTTVNRAGYSPCRNFHKQKYWSVGVNVPKKCSFYHCFSFPAYFVRCVLKFLVMQTSENKIRACKKNYTQMRLYKGTHSLWGIYGNIFLISNLKSLILALECFINKFFWFLISDLWHVSIG